MKGIEEGISQISYSSTSNTLLGNAPKIRTCVWNVPFETVFKATNAFGWPQLVVSVYGVDELGRDVIRGYGSVRIPTYNGNHILFVPLFKPISTSPLNGALSWLSGRLPEFLDPKFVSKNQGREGFFVIL